MKLPTYHKSMLRRIHSEERNSLLVFVGVVVLLSFCLCGCGGSQTVTTQASWAQYYTSLKDLKYHSDFAVSGDIAHIGDAVQPSDGSMVYSDVTLIVKSVFWNAHSQKTVPPTILFHENGGNYNGTTHVIEDDPYDTLFKWGNKPLYPGLWCNGTGHRTPHISN